MNAAIKNERVPVNPAMLKWARTQAGKSLDEVATKFAKIGSWENLESLPTAIENQWSLTPLILFV